MSEIKKYFAFGGLLAGGSIGFFTVGGWIPFIIGSGIGFLTSKIVENFIFRSPEVPPYPIPFAIVTYSPEALERGVKDSQNKIILEYFYNSFGNLIQKTHLYSQERVHAMENVRKIPVHDKTQVEDRFPVWSRVLPQEVAYTTK